MTMEEKEAFESLRKCYPEKLAEQYPEEYWDYFHYRFPNVTRNKMNELLKSAEA
jgi:hypothetical protein